MVDMVTWLSLINVLTNSQACVVTSPSIDDERLGVPFSRGVFV